MVATMAYVAPTDADLIARYPAFTAVDDIVIDTWLIEAAEECETWPESIRARAEMAYAAHMMALLGIVSGAVPAGLTSFKSGDFAATVDSAVASRTGFDATVYGREFAMLRRRSFAGPRPSWTTADA